MEGMKMLHVREFKTIDEFYDYAGLGIDEYVARHGIDKSFTGKTYDEAVEGKYLETSGLDKIMELPEFSGQAESGRVVVRKWDDQDGDEMDVERMRDGIPCIRKRVSVAGPRRGSRCVTVYVNLSEHWYTTYYEMLWKTFAACRLVDQLEARGQRVRVVAVKHTTKAYTNGDGVLFKVTIKEDGEPLNIGLLCAALSPWMFRVWMFATVHQIRRENDFVITGNMGFPASFKMDGGESACLIDTGECLNRESAERWLRSSEKLAA
jgi:hypothetical protein